MSATDRGEFGDFLRSRREKLAPKAVGLSNLQRRRTPGLRRQEVAELAGIGVDWYIRLEQGRAIKPSAATVDALARALRLSKAEHAHLRALAQDTNRRVFMRETLPDPIGRLVAGLNQPAYVIGRRWDVLAFNGSAAAIFPAFARVPAEDRNVLLYMLTNPDARALFGAGWAAEARRMVAQFRTTHDLWAADPAFIALLHRLRTESPAFTEWWDTHDISNTGTGEKLLNHPQRGPTRYEYATFQANEDPALRLAIYTEL